MSEDLEKVEAQEEKPQGKLKDIGARTATGVIFSVVVAACVFFSSISTMILVMVVAGFCCHEFCVMLRSDAKLPSETVGVVSAVLFPMAYFFLGMKGLLLWLFVTIMVEVLIYVLYPRMRITDCAVTVFAAVYTGLMPTALLIMRAGFASYMPWYWAGLLCLGVVVSIWANDVFAYLFGSLLGKHKLAPRISPAKSWEGAVAGLIGGIIVWLLMLLIPGSGLTWWLALIAAFFCCVLGIFGDLVESRIKRGAGFKDSGKILPGHGGFFDRCDTLIVVSAVAAVLFALAGLI